MSRHSPQLLVLILLFWMPLTRQVAAQSNSFQDVPANHWAYQAVVDLAHKGYVDGYSDSDFKGSSNLTRYEFATIIDRISETILTIQEHSHSGSLGTTPTGASVTTEDLDKIQVLADAFQPELDAIKADTSKLDSVLSDLRQDVADATNTAQAAQATANSAKQTAENSYGTSTSDKFSISGYVQTRFVSAGSGNKGVFTQGLNNSGNAGGIAAAYNGTYAEGGTNASFEVRRARIYIEGNPTTNTFYQLQVDVSGAVNNYSSSNSQLTLEQAFGTYKFGDGSVKYPNVSAGQISNPFGYSLSASQTILITPERPLAFQQTTNVGLFDNQDYDKGASLVYGPKQIKFTYALLNGTGRQSENVQSHFDSVVRLAYGSPTKIFTVGTSYYDGDVARGRNTGDGDATIPYTQETYTEPKKQLFGFDGQATYKGYFTDFEYIRGTYEKRSYFDENAATPGTNPLGFQTDNYVKNNQVQGYYAWGGYTFGGATSHPFTLAGDYDVFQRSIVSSNDPGNSLQSSGSGGKYFNGGSSFDDVNAGFGVLYNLDRSSRVRLWVDKPFAVAHAPGTPTPTGYELYTAEYMVKF